MEKKHCMALEGHPGFETVTAVVVVEASDIRSVAEQEPVVIL